LTYLRMIANAIMGIFQLCWLMMEHPLVCTLSAAW
jgi:hypothetical protein